MGVGRICIEYTTVLEYGYEEWLLDAAEDAGCFVVSVDTVLPQRDIAVQDVLTHLVVQRGSDQRKLARSEDHGTYPVCTLQEARAAHHNFSIEVHCDHSAAFDVLKCSVFTFPREGNSTYIEFESLLKSLRVTRQRLTIGAYVCNQFSSWSKSLDKYGL